MSNAPTHAPETALDRLAPWLECIGVAAHEHSENPFRLSGLMLRETEAGWAPTYNPKGDPCGYGDSGHGYGLCQLDIRWHRAFVDSPAAKDPLEQLRYVCRELLAPNRLWFRRHLPGLDAELIERATFAAYNAGEGAVYHAIAVTKARDLQGRLDPDGPTAHHNYSRDVFARADALRGERPTLFDAAPEVTP